jgi:hypothetical protein
MRTTKGEAIMNGWWMKASPERSMIKWSRPLGQPRARTAERLNRLETHHSDRRSGRALGGKFLATNPAIGSNQAGS